MIEKSFQEGQIFVEDKSLEDWQQNQYLPPTNEQPNHLSERPTNMKLQRLILLLLLGVIFLFFLNLLRNGFTRSIKQVAFKKIFWLYTEALFDGESMNEIIYLHHQNHTFHEQGYEVRFVNSWNAYDYISDNGTVGRISKAMQNSQIDERVHNLLKLALLYEHGGVMINAKDTVIASDLLWVQNIFNNSQESQSDGAKVFLYDFSPSASYNFSDIFIAAQPKNLLFKEAFDALETLIRTGTHPYAHQTQILKRNQTIGVDYISGGLSSIFNLVAFSKSKQADLDHYDPKTYFSIQSLKLNNFIFLNELSQTVQSHIVYTIKYQEQLRSIINGSEIKLLFNVNQSVVQGFISQKVMYLNTKDPQPLPQSSLIQKVLSAPHNKEVFIDPLPERKFSLCLIMMDSLNKEQIEVTKKAFLNQTYKNWKLAIPSLENTTQKQESERVKIFKGRSNKVHNTEVACTKHCDPKGYAVLLNYGETFNSVEALQKIAETVSPRDTAVALISLQINNETKTQKDLPMFSRNQYAINKVNLQLLTAILNHVRIFSIQSFRYMPQMDIRDIFGKYFSDRMVFLMSLMQVGKVNIYLPLQFYLAKKYINTMNIPGKVYYVNQKIALKVEKMEQVDLQQLKKLRPRIQSEDIQQSMIYITRYKIPFSKMLAFNPGNDFVSVNDRKGPDLIPRIIHQAWLGSKITPARQYIYEKTRKMYPHYEVKLWREENITQQRFPLTYDLLQTLLKFNKRSPYNKLASVTDILRHQLLYHQGGFWKDSGMNLLRPIFDKFLKYKLFLPVDAIFRYRWLQGMCIFGNMPQYQNLWRITNFRNLNRMRIYDSFAMTIAGPVDFNQLLVGQQQFDPDILLMPYQTFYPGQVVQHPDDDLCTRQSKDLNGAKYEVEQNGWYLLSNCSEIYPLAFGIEHNRYGGTWQQKKKQEKKRI